MSPFWGSFFEHIRGCGRNTTLFFVVFAGLLFALLGCAVADNLGLFRNADQVLGAFSAIGLFTVVWFAVGFYKARKRRHEPFKRRPLSSDEAQRARSKLLKQKTMNGPQQQY